MPLALLRRIPPGCYFGGAIIALGFVALDIRGIFVGLVVMLVAAISPRYQRQSPLPMEIREPIRAARVRKPWREKWCDWFGTPGAVARTFIWLGVAGLAIGIVAGVIQVLVLVMTGSI